MKNSTKSFLFFALLVTITSAQIFAQSYTGYREISVVLKADSTAKSVLLSNLLEDRVGDQSPFIGAAAWRDNGKKLQCRSLLAFDYGTLPLLIKPSQITDAQLILNPLQLRNSTENKDNQSSKFSIRRVLQPWDDSLTSWLNQPLSNSIDEVVKQLPLKKKDSTIKIDVTKLVKNMFRYGNNGFMICYQDSLDNTSSLSQWFASAKNDNEKIRPLLVISFAIPYSYSNPLYNEQISPRLPRAGDDGNKLIQMNVKPEVGTGKLPKEPVVAEKVNN